MTGPPWYKRLPLVTPSGGMAVRAGYRPRIGCGGGVEPPTAGTAEAAFPVVASTPQQNSSTKAVWIGWCLRDASMLVPPWGRRRPGCRRIGPDRGAYEAHPGPSVTHVTSAGVDRPHPDHAGPTDRATVRRNPASWSCSTGESDPAIAASSALNRGKSCWILVRPSRVSDTRIPLPSAGSFRRVAHPRPSRVRRTPVAVGRLMPTASANALAPSSPQTQSTHNPTNDVQDSRST